MTNYRGSVHECVPSSLGPGTPSFRLWRFSELPEEWQRGPGQSQLAIAAESTSIPVHALDCYTAVELPDTGFGRHYYAWAVQQLEAASSRSGLLPVMLSAQGPGSKDARNGGALTSAPLYRKTSSSLHQGVRSQGVARRSASRTAAYLSEVLTTLWQFQRHPFLAFAGIGMV